jgi:LPS-assembly lipoprotein
MRRWGILTAVWLLLSACGFQLRGTVALAPAYQALSVSGLAENNAMRLALENELAQRDVLRSGAKKSNVATLRIVAFDESNHVMAVDAIGSATDRQLLATLVFRVDAHDGQLLKPETRVTVSRFFQFDPANVLGRRAEEETIRAEMRREIVERVMRTLSKVS